MSNAPNAKLRKFTAAWMANGMNATDAAATVCTPGTKRNSLQAIGSKLLSEAREAGLIEAQLDRVRRKLGVDELIEQETEVACADITRSCDINPDGSFAFNLLKAQANKQTHLIKRLYHDAESGAPIIEYYPADAARARIGKWLGLGADVVQAAPPVQVNVQVILSQLSPSALLELERALQAGAGQAIGARDGPAPVDVTAVPVEADTPPVDKSHLPPIGGDSA